MALERNGDFFFVMVGAYLLAKPRAIYYWCFIPFLINAMVNTSITGTFVTLDDLIPWSNYVCMHTWYHFFEEVPLEVIQYGQKRAINKVLAKVK